MGSLYLWGHSIQEMGSDIVIGHSIYGVVVINGSLYGIISNHSLQRPTYLAEVSLVDAWEEPLVAAQTQPSCAEHEH